jgi:hypothetical protein
MATRKRGTVLTILLAMGLPSLAMAEKGGGKLDTARIEQLTGQKGKLDEKENVFKVSLPG